MTQAKQLHAACCILAALAECGSTDGLNDAIENARAFFPEHGLKIGDYYGDNAIAAPEAPEGDKLQCFVARLWEGDDLYETELVFANGKVDARKRAGILFFECNNHDTEGKRITLDGPFYIASASEAGED
jgi:hypothetical protein